MSSHDPWDRVGSGYSAGVTLKFLNFSSKTILLDLIDLINPKLNVLSTTSFSAIS